jgi:hypothetical protein
MYKWKYFDYWLCIYTDIFSLLRTYKIFDTGERR